MAFAKQESAVQLAKVSPAYLHSNSTCHTWPYSAFAELIDNACDPDVCAKEMWIDVETINGKESLIFKDNGNGMNPDKLHKMLSFGFSEKEANGQSKPIGRYGNGFKSGSMRLGDDALVFTQCLQTASVGLLSQTYLRDIEAETVKIPVVTWKISGASERVMKATPENKDSLIAILQHSLLKTQGEIERQLDSLLTYGTKIIIYNLKRDRSNRFELDFESDLTDIRYPETATLDTSAPDRPIAVPNPEYRKSLRKYCSILYKKPKMKIYLRGKKVQSTLIEWSLKRALVDNYKPKDCTKRTGIRLTFGYTRDTDPEAYGLMLYHNNRLIKAYKKVGYQIKAMPESIGVQGIAEVNLLEPNHMKQDFIRDGKYAHFIAQAARKLNEYVNETKFGTGTSTSDSDEDRWIWAQCDKCDSWRRLPREFKDDLPDKWFCFMNPDNMYNRCEIPEEAHLKDEDIVKPYEKTFKKLQAEEKRKEKLKKTNRKQSDTVKRQRSVADDDTQDIYIVDDQTPVILNVVDLPGLGGAKSTPVTEGMLRPSATVTDVQGRATHQQKTYREQSKTVQRQKCVADDDTQDIYIVDEQRPVILKTDREQSDTVQRQESVTDDDTQDIYIVDEQRPVIVEAQGGSGEDQDPDVDSSQTAFSSAVLSDKNDSLPRGRKQRFAHKRRSEDSEGSSTPAKVPNVRESGDASGYFGKEKSPVQGTSQGCGGYTNGACEGLLDNHDEQIDSSVESAVVSSLKKELIFCLNRLEEKDQALKRMEEEKLRKEEELKKKKTELLNIWALRKTDQEVLNKLKKENEELNEKVNTVQRQHNETEEKFLSEKRQLIHEIEVYQAEKASFQQELVKWKREATNLANAITKREQKLESIEFKVQIQQECDRQTQAMEENRA